MIPAPGKPVKAMISKHEAPGRVATKVLIYKSLVRLDVEKGPQGKWSLIPGTTLARQIPFHWNTKVGFGWVFFLERTSCFTDKNIKNKALDGSR